MHQDEEAFSFPPPSDNQRHFHRSSHCFCCCPDQNQQLGSGCRAGEGCNDCMSDRRYNTPVSFFPASHPESPVILYRRVWDLRSGYSHASHPIFPGSDRSRQSFRLLWDHPPVSRTRRHNRYRKCLQSHRKWSWKPGRFRPRRSRWARCFSDWYPGTGITSGPPERSHNNEYGYTSYDIPDHNHDQKFPYPWRKHFPPGSTYASYRISGSVGSHRHKILPAPAGISGNPVRTTARLKDHSRQ